MRLCAASYTHKSRPKPLRLTSTERACGSKSNTHSLQLHGLWSKKWFSSVWVDFVEMFMNQSVIENFLAPLNHLPANAASSCLHPFDRVGVYKTLRLHGLKRKHPFSEGEMARFGSNDPRYNSWICPNSARSTSVPQTLRSQKLVTTRTQSSHVQESPCSFKYWQDENMK